MRAILAPIRCVRRGLIPALGGRKAVCSFVARRGETIDFGWHCCSDRFSARCRFGHAGLTRSHTACVALPGFGGNGWLAVGSFAPDAVASVTAGGKFAGALRHSGFGFRQVSWGVSLAGIRPA